MIGTVCREKTSFTEVPDKIEENVFSDIQTPGSLQKYLKMYLLFYTD